MVVDLKEILISAILFAGIATAINPILISGKDFSDFNLTDTDLGISGDLGGAVWSNALTKDNMTADGTPFGGRAPLLVGSVMGYNRTEQALNGTVR